MIELKEVKKRFETRKKSVDALKGITFTAKPGQIYGLIGPNGAGKTTALRSIATLLRPDSGSIVVSGHNTVEEPRAVRDIIGFLTSEMKLSGNLSPRELLEFFGRLNHLDEDRTRRRIEELASHFEMDSYLDVPVVKLSTGMKQKASIAVSIIHDPEVIVFDEPTAGLDILASKIVVDFLLESKEKGRTVMLSTHMLHEADKLCDAVGILVEGELLANGSRQEVLESYKASDLEEVFFSAYRQQGRVS